MNGTEIPRRIKVAHFHRRPRATEFSIERLFGQVRAAMPSEIECTALECKFESRGIWARLYNTVEASWRQADVNHITGDVHYLAFSLSRKTLLTIHDCGFTHRLSGIRQILFRLLYYRLPVLKAGLVSVISEFTKLALLRHVKCPPEKIHVVPCCLSTDFVRVPKPFSAMQPRLLFIGTKPNKNLARLAEALEGISCELRIVGRLSTEQAEKLLLHQVKYSLCNRVSDTQILQEYRDCDIVVFPSTYEGFGLPIIEGQATGRPVITSNICSMPEVAADAACYVNPFDVSSIRGGILRVVQDTSLREELVTKGLSNVRRFTSAAVAQRYADLYRKLHAR